MKTKEAWIEETMNSLDGIRCAPADPGFFLKIQLKADHQESNAIIFKRPLFWPIAAGIALLIALNIFGVLHFRKTQIMTQQVPAAIVTDYLSYLGPIKL